MGTCSNPRSTTILVKIVSCCVLSEVRPNCSQGYEEVFQYNEPATATDGTPVQLVSDLVSMDIRKVCSCRDACTPRVASLCQVPAFNAKPIWEAFDKMGIQ